MGSPAGNRRHTIKQRAAIRDHVARAKQKPCMDCKGSYPAYCMDFDHVSGSKRFALSKAAAAKYSIERVDQELAKCELVCANCHRIRTFERAEKCR